MRKPELGDVVIAYIKDENQIGSPIVCVPVIVTDSAMSKNDKGQEFPLCGGIALFGPALTMGPEPILSAKALNGAPMRMVSCAPIGPLPYCPYPKPGCWTWAAQHPGGHILVPKGQRGPRGVGEVDPKPLPD